MIKIDIQVFPTGNRFSFNFHDNMSFGDLKNELEEKIKINKDEFYMEINDNIMNDDLILKDNGVINDNVINVVRNDCIKVKLGLKDWRGQIQTKKSYIPISDFQIIKPNENKEITNEEIKHVIDLLKDESSDRLSILSDLLILWDKCLIIFNIEWFGIRNMFFEMDFFSSAMKIFEDEKGNDEKIINLLVIIMYKMSDCFFKKGKDLYKAKDLIDPLINFIKNNKDDKAREDAVNTLVVIANKYTSDFINCDKIKNIYKNILPSCSVYSDKDKKYIYILFEELIKEGIIKKGEEGSEIIEEILYLAEMTNKKKDIINIEDEELIKEINNYIIIAKEKGFESKVWNNKNDIIGEDIYIDLIELCKENDSKSDNCEEEIIKEEEIQKIKKFCDYVASHSFDIQIYFIHKLYTLIGNYIFSAEMFNYFSKGKNGLFLYYYFPLLFKIYHFEEIIPLFFRDIKCYAHYLPECYQYITKLCNEMLKRKMKESEEKFEINEENTIIIIFFWNIITGECEENELYFLINSTLKVFDWLGRIDEEKEEELKAEEIELNKIKEKNTKKMSKVFNKKEMFINQLLNCISNNLGKFSVKNKESIKKDKRIIQILLDIVKNHLKNERCLIQKGNKKRIIDYIVYSYKKMSDTSNLLSSSSTSFPFSHNTVVYILYYIIVFLSINDFTDLKKDLLTDLFELFNIYIDVIKIIEECDIKKEIEGELLLEWDDDIINKIKEKVSFEWNSVSNILYSYLKMLNLSSLNNENNNITKRLTNLFFHHSCNNNSNNEEKRKEKNGEDEGEMLVIRLFMTDDDNRKGFLEFFIYPFTNYYYYSIFNLYYLVNKSEEGCNLINILMKELSGEIVDRIKKREGKNIIKERRRYERERNEKIFNLIAILLKDILSTFKDENRIYLGEYVNKDIYNGKDKEIKEEKDYVSDVIEEEDMRECLILYLRHSIDCYNNNNNNNTKISYLSIHSNNALCYLFSVNKLN